MLVLDEDDFRLPFFLAANPWPPVASRKHRATAANVVFWNICKKCDLLMKEEKGDAMIALWLEVVL